MVHEDLKIVLYEKDSRVWLALSKGYILGIQVCKCILLCFSETHLNTLYDCQEGRGQDICTYKYKTYLLCYLVSTKHKLLVYPFTTDLFIYKSRKMNHVCMWINMTLCSVINKINISSVTRQAERYFGEHA